LNIQGKFLLDFAFSMWY